MVLAGASLAGAGGVASEAGPGWLAAGPVGAAGRAGSTTGCSGLKRSGQAGDSSMAPAITSQTSVSRFPPYRS